jgi:hypothetical protein
MRLRLPLFTSAIILAVAACGSHGPVADQANDTGNLVAVVDRANATANTARAEAGKPPSPPPQPPAAATSPTGAPPPALVSTGPIPAPLQGRWGLTPADCTSTRGDAKGLLVVTGGELRFYESRAVPAPGIQADDGAVSGNFHFTGEGQAWTKYEALKRSGDKLTRTENNPAASFTYAKC